MERPRLQSFRDFWPYYVGEHAHPTCRRLHFIGTTLVVALFVTAVVTGRTWLMWLMPFAGYGFAWYAHFAVEKNRPATFTYPFWSLGADFVMWAKMATGKMDEDLRRYAISWQPPEQRPPRHAE